MAYQDLAELMEKSNKLTPDEKLQLIAHLTNNMQDNGHQPQKRYSWHDIRGAVPYPFFGEDAQDWISRTRQEGDEERERQWRKAP